MVSIREFISRQYRNPSILLENGHRSFILASFPRFIVFFLVLTGDPLLLLLLCQTPLLLLLTRFDDPS
jgi:hypothetical protein